MNKKLKIALITLFAVTTVAPIQAQLKEKVTDDFRIVNTPFKNVRDFTDKVVISTALFGSVLTIEQEHGIDSIHWNLSFSYTQTKERANIKKNANLLLKLGNEEVIKLQANSDNTYDFKVETVSGVTVTNYTVSALYAVYQKDLERIIEYGVVKLRAETHLSPIEKTWKKDKIGVFYGEYYDQMKSTLSERKVFDADF